MADYLVTEAELQQTAGALRTKGGTSAPIEWGAGTGFKAAVEALPSGGGGITVSDSVSYNKFEGRKVVITETISGVSISASVTRKTN